MNCSYITNPITYQKYSINSKQGKKILNNYIKNYIGGNKAKKKFKTVATVVKASVRLKKMIENINNRKSLVDDKIELLKSFVKLNIITIEDNKILLNEDSYRMSDEFSENYKKNLYNYIKKQRGGAALVAGLAGAVEAEMVGKLASGSASYAGELLVKNYNIILNGLRRGLAREASTTMIENLLKESSSLLESNPEYSRWITEYVGIVKDALSEKGTTSEVTQDIIKFLHKSAKSTTGDLKMYVEKLGNIHELFDPEHTINKAMGYSSLEEAAVDILDKGVDINTRMGGIDIKGKFTNLVNNTLGTKLVDNAEYIAKGSDVVFGKKSSVFEILNQNFGSNVGSNFLNTKYTSPTFNNLDPDFTKRLLTAAPKQHNMLTKVEDASKLVGTSGTGKGLLGILTTPLAAFAATTIGAFTARKLRSGTRKRGLTIKEWEKHYDNLKITDDEKKTLTRTIVQYITDNKATEFVPSKKCKSLKDDKDLSETELNKMIFEKQNFSLKIKELEDKIEKFKEDTFLKKVCKVTI